MPLSSELDHIVELVLALKKLLSLFAPRNTPLKAHIPDNQRVYAIGDIHGRLDLLEIMLDRLASDEARRSPCKTTYIFLGDVIDRGPNSAGVVEKLIAVANERHARFVRGNHEEVLLQMLNGCANVARTFTRMGGRETALSYGLSEQEYNSSNFDDLAERLQPLIPKAHVAFYSAMEEMILIGDYAFVHAGIDPMLSLANQNLGRTRWIRKAFTSAPGPFEKVIVHGHSITPDIDLQRHRIGLDTGAYTSGVLSAMGFEESRRWAIQVST